MCAGLYVDDNVDVLSQTRLTPDTTGKRADDRVLDLKPLQLQGRIFQQLTLFHRTLALSLLPGLVPRPNRGGQSEPRQLREGVLCGSRH